MSATAFVRIAVGIIDLIIAAIADWEGSGKFAKIGLMCAGILLIVAGVMEATGM